MFLCVGSVDLNAEITDLTGYEGCLNIVFSMASLRFRAGRNDDAVANPLLDCLICVERLSSIPLASSITTS